ncbi:hypothetical protein IV733_000609 [Salmonella enterica]|uniref:Uncharacterized protein n=2 Tax=Salmonella enterica TaxID=28901 RepID=A0A5V5UMN1_SALNE|nr:hypothetical protein [Escherichia coli]EAA5682334.1 hypothetical protein [Salmonella enterica subsp. enterica serovar Newport]EAB3699294.1 hypothetical protein [Salmonella enterica]EDU0995428.1 hypothetical protein [Salmonella enterica subsp. enterica serovar Baildon]EEN4418113.1 hypothetical protein [Salmonella enterica subsp. enterica serovar Enteritidis]EAB3772367.1 hypothetical protein [Salmonella enterica]
MDESRKKFEEYVAKKLRLPFEMITEARNGDRYFAFSSMDIRHSLNEWWALWQASRAAIEIECPGKREREAFSTDFEDGVTFGYNDAISECEGLIRAAGVKVKE